MNNNQLSKKIAISLITLLAIGERVFFDLGPNVELITAAMILASFYLGNKYAFLLTFLILAISDTAIGNTSIYLFTWTGFLIPALFASRVFNHQSSLSRRHAGVINNSLRGVAMGIGANIFFFLWTNFGVWVMDSFGMYSNNLSGLISSYINALPFLRYQLTSTIVFVPIVFVVFNIMKNLIPSISPKLHPQPSIQNSQILRT